jgi:phosphatidylinositol glycan class B
LSLVLLVGVLLSWILARRSSLTWVTLSFFLVHIAIGHKEFRFLFPILPAVPIQAAMAVKALRDRGIRWSPASGIGKLATRSFVGLLLVINFGALVVLTVLPPRLEVLVYRQVYGNAPLTLITEGPDPYVMANLQINYYRHPGMELELSSDPAGRNREQTYWLLRQDPDASPASDACELRFSTLPEWLKSSSLYDLLQRARALEWSLYSCPAADGN